MDNLDKSSKMEPLDGSKEHGEEIKDAEVGIEKEDGSTHLEEPVELVTCDTRLRNMSVEGDADSVFTFDGCEDDAGAATEDELDEREVQEDEYMYHYEDDRRREVTTSHFIPKEDRAQCQTCATSFMSPLSLYRPHHCRRCGDIFCRNCLIYKKKLNAWAQPDNNGILCKVCIKCYGEAETVLFGVKRSQTEAFVSLRKQCKTERRHIMCDVTIDKRNATIVPACWREQLKVDVPRECQRLLEGFRLAVGSSDTHKALHELTDKIIVPTWQKAQFWSLEIATLSCRHCGGQLKGKKFRNCRVCALALCKKCSYKELLVYYEDTHHHDTVSDKITKLAGKYTHPAGKPTQPAGKHAHPSESKHPLPPDKDTQPKLAIIKVAGSPEKEPRYSLRLTICKLCRSELVQRQSRDPDWYRNSARPPDPDLMSHILGVDQTFRDLITDIHQNVERLGDYSETKKTLVPKEVTTTKTPADHDASGSGDADNSINVQQEIRTLKENIQDCLGKYYKLYQDLKLSMPRLEKTAKNGELKFARHYIQSRKNSYITLRSKESMYSHDEKPA